MRSSPKRPRSIRLLLLVLLLFGVWQAATVVALSKQTALLLSLSVKPDPRLRLAAASGWMILFWVLGLAIGKKIPATRWLTPIILSLFTVYEFVILAFFAQVPINGQQWFVNILLAVMVVLFSCWILNRNSAKLYFSEETPVRD